MDPLSLYGGKGDVVKKSINPESSVGREDRLVAELPAPGAAEPLMRDGKGGCFYEQKSAGRSGDCGACLGRVEQTPAPKGKKVRDPSWNSGSN